MGFHLWPCLMKLLMEVPLFVMFAFPPRAIIMAVKMALFPPESCKWEEKQEYKI